LSCLKALTRHSKADVYISGARNQHMKKNVVFLFSDHWFLPPGHPPADFLSLQPRKCEDIQGFQGNGFGNLTETSSSDFPLDFPLDFKSDGVKLSLRKAFKMGQNNMSGDKIFLYFSLSSTLSSWHKGTISNLEKVVNSGKYPKNT